MTDYWYCFKCGKKTLRILEKKPKMLGLMKGTGMEARHVVCHTCGERYTIYYRDSE